MKKKSDTFALCAVKVYDPIKFLIARAKVKKFLNWSDIVLTFSCFRVVVFVKFMSVLMRRFWSKSKFFYVILKITLRTLFYPLAF